MTRIGIGETLSGREGGIDRVANQARKQAQYLTSEAELKHLGGILKAWAPEFKISHPETNEEILTSIAEIMAPSPAVGTPRWELVAKEQRGISEEQTHYIMGLAGELNMVLPMGQEIPEELTRVPQVLPVIEGGANKTSVVRRGLAVDMLHKRAVINADAELPPMIQFGSSRQIPRLKNGTPNPEYQVALDICGHYFPKNINALDEENPLSPKEVITEQELNVGSALNEGWIKDRGVNLAPHFPGFEEALYLHREGYPALHNLVPSPSDPEKLPSLTDGIANLLELRKQGVDDSENCVVVATNGQYRPKDEIMTAIACLRAKVEPADIRAIGDETGSRGPTVYTLEIGVLARTLLQFNRALVVAGRPPII